MTINKIWLTDDAVHIRTTDGREAKELFNDYARLRNASRPELEDFTANAFGIHWNQLNEDLSFEGFFKKKHNSPLYKLFLTFPEINVSALARRMGIKQSLMAQYIEGSKQPSKEHREAIIGELKKIGTELISVSI